MSSTFTTPIRIFKRNNPTNDGVIAPDNTGAAVVSQQATFTGVAAAGAISTTKIGESVASAFVIPAGSIISNVKLYETTAPSALTSGVITVAVDGVTIGTITANATGGVIDMAFSATATGAAEAANNGTADSVVTFTWARGAITGTMAGVLSVEYTARNADGSIIAYGSGYTNS
jgi:hypothetical protein